MDTFQCATCSRSFHSKSQLDQHRQDEHQMSVVVKCFDGSIITIDRHIQTRTFNCPLCNTALKRPKAIQRHARRDCRQKRSKFKTKVSVTSGGCIGSSTPDLLREIGLSVNACARVVICVSCQYVVGPEPKQVQSHLKRIHFSDRPDLPSIEQLGGVLNLLNLATQNEILSFGTDSRNDGVQPIEGLPIYDGVMCTSCQYMCCCVRTMKSHLKVHQSAQAVSVSLQTLFSGARKHLFRVSRPAIAQDNLFASDQFRGELEKFHDYHSLAHSDGDNERLLDPLLRQLHWHKKVPKYTDFVCSDLMNMCKLSKESAVDQNLFAAVSFYFVQGIKTIDTVSYVTRRYIIAGGTQVSSNHKGFGFVEDASGTYRRHMTKLIHMVAVCVEKKNSNTPVWHFDIPNDVGDAVMRLQKLCRLNDFVADAAEVQDEVGNVLKALYIDESVAAAKKPRDDFELYSIYRYVVCSSIIGGELERIKILETNNITSICAAFVYWARLFTLVTISATSARAENDDFYYIRDGVPTCFNAMLEVMKLGKCLSGPAEGQNPILHWIDDEMTSLVCRTATVTKLGLKNMATTLSMHIKRTLRQTLFLGFDIDNAKKQIGSTQLVDDINAKNDGCWFMSRSENRLCVEPQDLLAFLGSSKCAQTLWSESDQEWNIHRVKKWLLDCDEFMDDMLILMHLTFGQPARASELTTLRIRDSNLAFRSVYSIRNRFSLIQVYHKSFNVTGKFKPIARFAPSCLNADIILYFYLVRPVQAYLFNMAFPTQAHSTRCLDYVFVKDGKAMSPDRIRRSIAKGFAKFSDMKLDVSTYRHVASALLDPHFRDQRLSEDLLDEQAGHSHETASTVYGRSDNDPSTLSRDQLHKFWDGSRRWHHFLGLVEDAPPQRACTHTTNSIDCASHSHTTDISNQLATVVSSLSNVESQVHELRMKVTTRACIQASTQQQLPPISPQAFASAKHVVDKFIGTPSGSFLSVEQGIALSLLISEPRKHRMIILPTGGGKSILYMASFIANPKCSRTSIVIVPTVALLSESVVKANLRNILSCKYNSDLKCSGSQFRLVFAAVEHVGQDDFREYLVLLNARGLLHAIFIDEAHLVVTASTYRPQMALIPTLIGVGAPIVLLSATIPIKMEKDFSILFRVEFETIRAQTNRKNISYCVSEVSDIVEATITTMKTRQSIFQGSRNRGIAYCSTRREVDELCHAFESKTGFPISGFHSGMEPQGQSLAVAKWKNGQCIWMIATTAFGVGIDYPSVRVVLHVGTSWSLLNYAQETGRAGRDGAQSQALTLTNRQYQTYISKSVNEHSRDDFMEITRYLNTVNQCRRQTLQSALDGHGVPCISDSSNYPCDVCCSLRFHDGINQKGRRHDQDVEMYAQIANKQNSRDRIIQAEISEFMEGLSLGSCSICWLDGRPSVNLRSCHCFDQLCYKCQSRHHFSTACSLKLLFLPGTCYVCALPWMDVAAIGRSMHEGNDYRNCSHPAKGFVVSAVWAAFHRHKIHEAPTEAEAFSLWLPKRAEGSAFTNLIVTFYELVKNQGPIRAAE